MNTLTAAQTAVLEAAYQAAKTAEDAAYAARSEAERRFNNWDDIEPYVATFVKAFDARKRAENALCGTNYHSLV